MHRNIPDNEREFGKNFQDNQTELDREMESQAGYDTNNIVKGSYRGMRGGEMAVTRTGSGTGTRSGTGIGSQSGAAVQSGMGRGSWMERGRGLQWEWEREAKEGKDVEEDNEEKDEVTALNKLSSVNAKNGKILLKLGQEVLDEFTFVPDEVEVKQDQEKISKEFQTNKKESKRFRGDEKKNKIKKTERNKAIMKM